MALSIPPPTQPLTQPYGADDDPERRGYITEPWYRIFGEISRLRTDLEALRRLTPNMGAIDCKGSYTVTFVGVGST